MVDATGCEDILVCYIIIRAHLYVAYTCMRCSLLLQMSHLAWSVWMCISVLGLFICRPHSLELSPGFYPGLQPSV